MTRFASVSTQEGVKECLFTSYRQKPAVSRQTDDGWSWKRLGNERHRKPDRVSDRRWMTDFLRRSEAEHAL